MTQSSTIFALTGPSALSSFRAARLLAAIRSLEKSAASLSGRFVHFIHASRPLDESERARLEGLLDYGDAASSPVKGAALLVVPRLGTISPWASKATDIAHNTGLKVIRRIERGTLYVIGAGRKQLTGAELARVQSVLHDRMTESVIDPGTNPALIFQELDSKPMQTVALLKGGRAALERANVQMGLALSSDEIEYLIDAFTQMRRDRYADRSATRCALRGPPSYHCMRRRCPAALRCASRESCRTASRPCARHQRSTWR